MLDYIGISAIFYLLTCGGLRLPNLDKGKGRGIGSKPDPLYNWEGALQLLFYKLCLKMIDHGSRSTWGPGLSGSR